MSSTGGDQRFARGLRPVRRTAFGFAERLTGPRRVAVLDGELLRFAARATAADLRFADGRALALDFLAAGFATARLRAAFRPRVPAREADFLAAVLDPALLTDAAGLSGRVAAGLAAAAGASTPRS